MDKNTYSSDDIEYSQMVVKHLIFLFSKKGKFLNSLFFRDYDSFHFLVAVFKNEIFNYLDNNKNIDSNLRIKKPDNSTIIEKTVMRLSSTGEVKGSSTIREGIYTFVVLYLTLFLISKGLEKHGFRISKNFFIRLPYTSFDAMKHNIPVLGIDDTNIHLFNTISLKLKIPILIDDEYIFGGGACPFSRVKKGEEKKGQELNNNLYNACMSFFDLFYAQKLSKYEITFKNSPIDKTPDFVNIMLGRFEEINIEHLKKNSHLFEIYEPKKSFWGRLFRRYTSSTL
ncbi:MAG: hypothetical protein ACMXYB_02490 [Candidatus Woesearchaeota archaeon]